MLTAIEAAPEGFAVIPAVGGYGSRESVQWAEQAAEAGAPAVMALPPNSYRADDRSVLAHYRAVAAVGLPVVAYNNPFDTKVDLVPETLARLHAEGLIVAVKEFAGDPRRAYEVRELAPELDVLIGSGRHRPGNRVGRWEGLGLGLHERIPAGLREALPGCGCRGILRRRCRSTEFSIRCCDGTRRPSSSRRSSSRWTSSVATAARAPPASSAGSRARGPGSLPD